jgi:hypothetical protein
MKGDMGINPGRGVLFVSIRVILVSAPEHSAGSPMTV